MLCRDCPIKDANQIFRERCTELLSDVAESKNYSLDSLINAVNVIAGIDNELDGRGFPNDTTILTAAMIDVLRREKYKAERIEEFNRKSESQKK